MDNDDFKSGLFNSNDEVNKDSNEDNDEDNNKDNK